MYLKEIKAFGFKSFADKIKIELGPHINGIVGPNGSGKSNVVDAVRWVLGEQSVKSLRGDGNMADVIFSGSKSRKPLSSASVTLIFDNSDHTLNIPFEEVSIKRVIYKTGENEYYLNNEKVRLKDIQDLLTDSGTAKESFNIISQGKIDEILLQKPTERRGMFEEASGVLKYKKRKEEALKKLEKTNQNLDRINDIITELSIQVEPLKEKSNKARRYLSFKEKLKNVEIALMTYDIKNYNDRFSLLTKEKDELNDAILKTNKDNITSDVDLINYKNSLREADQKLSKKQEELLKIIKQEETINTEIKLLKERQKYSLTNTQKEENLIKLNDKKLDLTNNINSLKNDIDIKKKEQEVLNNTILNLSKDYQSINDKLSIYNSDLSKNGRLLTDYKYKIETLDEIISSNSKMPPSIKNILNNKTIKGIYNTISKLLTIKEEYINLIDIALGGASNYIVVDTRETAKKCINFLKENNLGRASFYPLDVITPRFIDQDTLSKLKGQEGFIDIASNLTSYDSKYQNIILNQLGNVIATKDIDSANKISQLINHKYKIVTLDGSVINIGGSLTGGSLNTKNNQIKDKYELEDLINKYKLTKAKQKELEESLPLLEDKKKTINEELYKERSKLTTTEEIISNKSKILESFLNKLKSLNEEINSLSNNEDNHLYEEYNKITSSKSEIQKEIEILKLEKENLNDLITQIEEENKKVLSHVNKMEKDLNNKIIELNKIENKLDVLLINLNEEYNMTFENAKEKYHLELDPEEARTEVNSLKNEIKYLGEVDTTSIEEYDRINERYEFLKNQKEDLLKAENTLMTIIEEMDDVMKEKFIKTFYEIKEEFKKVFNSLFKGGTADLTLTDPDNILETGIEIIASPPGKSLKHLSLLSGGEKTFTAISLLFAILNIRPVPFAVLDEVEAALDEANVVSFGEYLKKYQDTQFIIITHKKKTMEFADILYGITMQESGVSKLVSVKLKDLTKNEEYLDKEAIS